MLQINNGSYKYNYVMLTYWIQFIDGPICIVCSYMQ